MTDPASSGPSTYPHPFFGRYYAVVYALFPFMLVSSVTGMDLCFMLLLLGWLAELAYDPGAGCVDGESLGIVFGFLGVLLIPELIHFSWTGLEELVLHHFRKIFLLALVVGTLRSKEHLERTVRLWVLAGAAASALTVVAVMTEWSFLSRFVEGGFRSGVLVRGSGPGNWKAVQFANVLACIFPFAFFRALRRGNPTKRSPGVRSTVYWLAALAIYLGLLVSLSRMPFLAVTLLLVGWLARETSTLFGRSGDKAAVTVRLRPILQGIGLLGCVALLAAVPFVLEADFAAHLDRVVSVPGQERIGYSAREELWLAVMEKTLEEPGTMLLGAGSEKGMERFKYLADEPLELVHGLRGTGIQRDHAHNNFVQYFLDYGLFGVLAYLGLWVYVGCRFLGAKRAGGRRTYVLAALFLILVFNLCGLTEYNWGRTLSHYNIVFGLSLCLVSVRVEDTLAGNQV